MKPELLSQVDSLRQWIADNVPNDPPATPTGFVLINSSGDNPQIIGLGWDDLPEGCDPMLEYMGQWGNLAGPSQWTQIDSNNSPGPDGVRGSLVLQNSDGQNIQFRLRAQRVADGMFSVPTSPLFFP